MKIDDLMEMKVSDLLDEYCVVYSPECGYNYGIAKWSDAEQIYEEFDLEDQYCFSGDSLIPLDYGFDCGEEVLELKHLKIIMDKLGIAKKQSCPLCGTEKYHYDYNEDAMVCEECGYIGEPEYENIIEEDGCDNETV